MLSNKKSILLILCTIAVLLCPVSVKAKAAALEQLNPNLVVESYSISNDTVESGTQFDLTLKLKNTSKHINIYNLVVSLSAESGLIYPVYGETNQLFFETIEAEETISVTISCMAAQSINKSAIATSINMRYDSDLAKSLSNTSAIYIPVKKDSKMMVTEYTLPSDVYIGTKTQFLVGYENHGSVDITNAMIYIEGNILEEQKEVGLSSYMAAGATSFSECPLTFQNTGMQTITVTFIYMDTNGNRYATEGGTYTVNVLSAYENDEITTEPGTVWQETEDIQLQEIIICVLIALILVSLIVILLRIRKK